MNLALAVPPHMLTPLEEPIRYPTPYDAAGVLRLRLRDAAACGIDVFSADIRDKTLAGQVGWIIEIHVRAGLPQWRPHAGRSTQSDGWAFNRAAFGGAEFVWLTRVETVEAAHA